MTTLAYRLLNVFTCQSKVLSGNPLCVFEQGAGLDSATMQSIARQFNLSETTFVLRSQYADAAVRIFTPTFELPFAGHPTLGTAAVCRSLKLGGWLIAHAEAQPIRLEISQGAQIGRASTLFLDVTSAGQILVGGEVIELGRGSITL
jgi:predicted PhzF superfamily epimerase YddE/YHI9